MAQPYTERPHPAGYVCYRAAQAPAIDGKVQGPGWDAAPWSAPFIDIEGPSKPAPYFNTQVKMLWNDTALYIGARMEEPQPWANLTLHDDIIYQDNDFEVFIDPDGDNHQYYEFEINAVGAWWDLFLVKPYRDGGPALHSFESVAPSEATQHTGPTGWSPVKRAVWVDGAVNDPNTRSTAWSVTVAFPWSLLQQAAHRDCPPKPGDQWRINFSRVQWKVKWDAAAGRYVKDPPDQSEHNWVWSPQWAIAMHQPETWGYLQFSQHTVDAASPPAAPSLAATQPSAPAAATMTTAPAAITSTAATATAPAAVGDGVSAPGGGDAGDAAAGAAAAAGGAAQGTITQPAQGLQGTASGSQHASVAGQDTAHEVFKPDPTWPLRSFLMEVYNRQKAMWQSQGVYADSLDALHLQPPPSLSAARLKVQATEVSFIATGQVASNEAGVIHRLYVNEESRITVKTIATLNEATRPDVTPQRLTPLHKTAACF